MNKGKRAMNKGQREVNKEQMQNEETGFQVMGNFPAFVLRSFFFILCFVLCLPVFSQSADEIENLLETEAINYGQAARLVLLASANRDLNTEAAFGFASENKWLPKGVEADDPARLNGFSLLIMRAFEIKGGAFYTLTGGAHYAYRELVYRNIIQGRSDPAMTVSGDLMLFIVNRALNFQENNQL
jgi:hypothetical protein